MASKSSVQDPSSEDGINELLHTGIRAEEYIHKFTNTYAASPNCPLDRLSRSPADLKNAESPPDALNRQGIPSIGSFPQLENKGAAISASKTDEVGKAEQSLKNVMRQYENAMDSKHKLGINPDNEHSVPQLASLITESMKNLDDPKGLWGRVRHACRKLAENKETIDGWLGLFPSDSQYLSVVCGGLKLVLKRKAALRAKQLRDSILEALANIPTILNGTKRVLHIYKHSETLVSLSKAFYISILDTLGQIIRYLQERHSPSRSKMLSPNLLKSRLNPEKANQDILDMIKNMQMCRDAFNEEADICQKESIHELSFASNDTNDKMENIRSDLRDFKSEQNESSLVLNKNLVMIAQDQSRQTEVLEAIMELLRGGNSMKNYAVLMGAPKDTSVEEGNSSGLGSTAIKNRMEEQNVSPINKRSDSKTLLMQLDYDLKSVRHDLTSLHNMGQNLLRDDQERTMHLIKSPGLANWLTSRSSQALFVNGSSSNIQRRSGLSFVCSRLAFAFERLRIPEEAAGSGASGVIPLYFFCGEHASCDVSWESPSGVINNLLAQLLAHSRKLQLDLTQTIDLGRFNSKNVGAVARRFKYVLKEFPAGMTVFCIIDGLSYYLDNNETTKDAEKLVHQLLKLSRIKTHKHHCTFKLLVTAPKRLHIDWLNDLDSDEVLTLPEALPFSGGFTEMKWTYSVGQQLENIYAEEDE